MKTRILGAALLALALTTAVFAQEKSDVAAPAEADRRAAMQQQQRVAGLLDAQAVLQKEIDSAIADFNRTISRMQAAAPAGMELSPQLTYVKKPAAPKIDPPKDPDSGRVQPPASPGGLDLSPVLVEVPLAEHRAVGADLVLTSLAEARGLLPFPTIRRGVARGAQVPRAEGAARGVAPVRTARAEASLTPARTLPGLAAPFDADVSRAPARTARRPLAWAFLAEAGGAVRGPIRGGAGPSFVGG